MRKPLPKELVNQLIAQSPDGQDEQERRAFIEEELNEVELNIDATKAAIDQKEQEYQVELSAFWDYRKLESEIGKLDDKLTTLRRTYADLLAQTRNWLAKFN